jgi:outer membrane lipoprotein
MRAGNRIIAMRGQWLLFGTVALLSACASGVPDPIRQTPPSDVRMTEVQRAPASFRGTLVRWGGAIVTVRNLKDETQIEIVSRRLDSSGRPLAEDRSEGRFLAKLAGFLDPAIYAAGRDITVNGRVEGAITQAIGEHSYTYPVVQVEHIYLWEPLPPLRYRDYDPFWHDPFYPWGYPYWPYHRPRFFP